MGSGHWDAHVYSTTTEPKLRSGTAFTYSTNTMSAPPETRKIHPSLDPKKVAGPNSPLVGQPVRECRDSTEHPNATPIAVFFDQTGSMGECPKIFIGKMKELFSLLLRKGYVEDPQVLIGAIGDAVNNELFPLQVGEFESDNRIDDTLDNVILEHNGGGGNHESYDLALWYMGHQVVMDSWEKRGKKGYLFVVGDERCYESLSADIIEKYTGIKAQGPIPLSDTCQAVQEKFETYFIIPTQGSYPTDSQKHWWTTYLPSERILVLQDTGDVAELIAITIGTHEGVIDLATGLADLAEVGSTAGENVGKALAAVGAVGKTVTTTAPGDISSTEDDVTRS